MTEGDLVGRLGEPGTVLLDTILPDDLGRWTLLFTDPQAQILARSPAEVREALRVIDRYSADNKWLAGYINYEAGYALESRFSTWPWPDERDGPLLWFGVYDVPTEVNPAHLDHLSGGAFEIIDPVLSVAREQYLEKVARVKHHIAEGDVYQVNLTAPLRFGFRGDAVTLYGRLRVRQPVPYGAFIRGEDLTVLSLSPELFFSRSGPEIVTRPMKGTAPVTGDDSLDRLAKERLRADPKNRAENLMIVDLLRNDLSICCQPGSVQVAELFGVQRYPTVLQMTSTVAGRLQEGASYVDLFEALFPSGSVTGAPKIRAMELIQELEPHSRGIYCGAVGYVAPGDRATFNVAIRTITLQGADATMGTGSGIVSDSVAEDEYDECLLKTRFLVGEVDG